MAERRMFSKKITDDDNFLSLSSSAQALYLHLNMAADDDGFCNQVSISMFKAHASTQDLQTLIDKRYVYQFESGVVVVKHWKMVNKIKGDRYKPTAFQEELNLLETKDNGVYTCPTWNHSGDKMETERRQIGDTLEPQVRLGKDRLGKDRLVEAEDSGKAASASAPIKELYPENCDQILELWNQSNITQHMKKFPILGRRAENTRLCLQYVDSFNDFLNVINILDQQAWFRKQAEIGKKLSYDWFCDPNNFLKIIEGNYEQEFGKGSDVPEGWEVVSYDA